MALPAENSAVTAAQVAASINLDDFPNAVPGTKGWHDGQFEPWALEFGYKPEGIPRYGEVMVDGVSVHIYWLNDGHQQPIIMTQGQTPATYHVTPI